MAKKVRTPPPPKRVQAPQKRETRRAAGIQTRPPWFYAALGAGAVAVIAAIVIGVIVVRDSGGSTSSDSSATVASWNRLPGIRKTKAPWPPEYQYLADRLPPLGLNTLPQEAVTTHYHSHLDIFVDGKKVEVPALIGINTGAQYITELHTHDTSGVMHVESPTKRNFTLGQFFGVWGVRLDSNCIGGYCKPKTPWRVYVNGLNQPGNPAELVLKKHQEIAMVIGDKRPKQVPSTYNFGGL